MYCEAEFTLVRGRASSALLPYLRELGTKVVRVLEKVRDTRHWCQVGNKIVEGGQVTRREVINKFKGGQETTGHGLVFRSIDVSSLSNLNARFLIATVSTACLQDVLIKIKTTNLSYVNLMSKTALVFIGEI